MSKKELDILFPQETKKVIGGVEFTIREFVAKEIGDVVSLASALTSENGVSDALQNDSERLFRLLASVTGVPVATLEKTRLSVIANIIADVVETNSDFFVQALPKAISRASKSMTAGGQS